MPIVLGALLAAGCGPFHTVRLWADTASPTGQMALAKHQWAYDGEPVTFVLDCPAGVNYAVFSVDGGETVVKEEDKDVGKYTFTRTFKAGEKPMEYTVRASTYVVRGRRDWYYDNREDKWYYHPGAGGDRRDVPIGTEQSIRVTCYRAEVRLRFDSRGGAPRRVELALVRGSGEKTVVPPKRADAGPKATGFVLLGPDAKGACEVDYTPTHTEVSRAGTTQVDLVVTHADGSQERIRQSLETP